MVKMKLNYWLNQGWSILRIYLLIGLCMVLVNFVAMTIPGITYYIRDPKTIIFSIILNPFNLAYIYATPAILFLMALGKIFYLLISKYSLVNGFFNKTNMLYRKFYNYCQKHTLYKYLYWYFRWIGLITFVYIFTLSILTPLVYPTKWLFSTPISVVEINKFLKACLDSIASLPQNLLGAIIVFALLFVLYVIGIAIFLIFRMILKYPMRF